jgi:hypothetical protein
MPSVIEIKSGHTPEELRRLAANSKHANQSRRLLSLAAVLDGKSRAEAAKIGGMDRKPSSASCALIGVPHARGDEPLDKTGKIRKSGTQKWPDRFEPDWSAHQLLLTDDGPVLTLRGQDCC